MSKACPPAGKLAPRPINAVMGYPPFMAREVLEFADPKEVPGACQAHDDAGLVFTALAIALGPPPAYPEGRAPWEAAATIFSSEADYATSRQAWFKTNGPRTVATVKKILQLAPARQRLDLKSLFCRVLGTEDPSFKL